MRIRVQPWRCAVVVWLWIFTLFAAAPPDIQPNIVYYNTQNTTQGSIFLQNLNTVLGNLSEETPRSSSATYAYGNYPDSAYGSSECYNLSRGDCGQCFNTAVQKLKSVAPLAVGAQIFINQSVYRCYLRYENYKFEDDRSAPLPAPPPATPPVSVSGGSSSSKTTSIVIGTVVAAAVVLCGSCILVYRKRSKSNKSMPLETRHIYDPGDDIEASIEGPHVYRYQELQTATQNFSQENKLGQGGFGTVYKGTLRDGTEIAVKKLLNLDQGKDEFVNEISIINEIQQRNLVRLMGYCVEGDQRLLVLEFLRNGSLDQALFGGRIAVDWPTRYQIAVGIARGLAYLHEESGTQIIHRDIKASNILLDDKLNPKISDFGISKLFDRDKGFTSTRIAGTFGYLAPEYALRGRLTAKADVFSFGVLLMEIVSGRKCHAAALPPEQEVLIEWAWLLHQKDDLETLIDNQLELNNDAKEEALRTLRIGLLCTQHDPEARPIMSKVVAMLLHYLELQPISTESPAYFTTPQSWTNSSNSNTKNSTGSTTSRSQKSQVTEVNPR